MPSDLAATGPEPAEPSRSEFAGCKPVLCIQKLSQPTSRTTTSQINRLTGQRAGIPERLRALKSELDALDAVARFMRSRLTPRAPRAAGSNVPPWRLRRDDPVFAVQLVRSQRLAPVSLYSSRRIPPYWPAASRHQGVDRCVLDAGPVCEWLPGRRTAHLFWLRMHTTLSNGTSSPRSQRHRLWSDTNRTMIGSRWRSEQLVLHG